MTNILNISEVGGAGLLNVKETLDYGNELCVFASRALEQKLGSVTPRIK